MGVLALFALGTLGSLTARAGVNLSRRSLLHKCTVLGQAVVRVTTGFTILHLGAALMKSMVWTIPLLATTAT